MNKANRNRLLALARLLDRAAAGIRAYTKKRTPKRGPRVKSDAPTEAEVVR